MSPSRQGEGRFTDITTEKLTQCQHHFMGTLRMFKASWLFIHLRDDLPVAEMDAIHALTVSRVIKLNDARLAWRDRLLLKRTPMHEQSQAGIFMEE